MGVSVRQNLKGTSQPGNCAGKQCMFWRSFDKPQEIVKPPFPTTSIEFEQEPQGGDDQEAEGDIFSNNRISDNCVIR